MKRLGDILIESGFLSAAELSEALTNSKESGKRLGEVIVDMGLMSEFDILRAVSSQYEYPIIDLTSIEIDPKATALFDEKYCLENVVLPIGFDEDNLVVAIDDPMNILTIDDLQFRSDTMYRRCLRPRVPSWMPLKLTMVKSRQLRPQKNLASTCQLMLTVSTLNCPKQLTRLLLLSSLTP